MHPTYIVEPARLGDAALLPSIELAAARLLAGHAPESVLAEATSVDALRAAERDGLLWVARSGDSLVGFAHLGVREPGSVHLEEIDVLPQHGRRGIGSRLVRAVCDWAARAGFDAVTLTTFRDVPFNMPFYERQGFAEIDRRNLSPAIRAILADEERRGLDPHRRVAMRRGVRRKVEPPQRIMDDNQP